MYLQKLKEYVNELFLNDNITSIVDIGCRSAEWLNYFQEKIDNKEIIMNGIDSSSLYFDMLPHDPNVITLRRGNLNEKGFLKQEKYDLIFMKDIFEYILNKEQFIEELLNSLNEEGYIVAINCKFKNIQISGENTLCIKQAISEFANSCLNGELPDSSSAVQTMEEYFKNSHLYRIEKYCFWEEEQEWTPTCSGQLYLEMLQDMYNKMNQREKGIQIYESFNFVRKNNGYYFRRPYYIYKIQRKNDVR